MFRRSTTLLLKGLNATVYDIAAPLTLAGAVAGGYIGHEVGERRAKKTDVHHPEHEVGLHTAGGSAAGYVASAATVLALAPLRLSCIAGLGVAGKVAYDAYKEHKESDNANQAQTPPTPGK